MKKLIVILILTPLLSFSQTLRPIEVNALTKDTTRAIFFENLYHSSGDTLNFVVARSKYFYWIVIRGKRIVDSIPEFQEGRELDLKFDNVDSVTLIASQSRKINNKEWATIYIGQKEQFDYLLRKKIIKIRLEGIYGNLEYSIKTDRQDIIMKSLKLIL